MAVKRGISVLLVLILLGCLLMLPVSGAAELSFVAINDSSPLTLTLSGDQRPYHSGGTLYVPYTVFSASSLGFYPSYSAADKTLALFSRDKRLIFDLAAGTVTDEKKQVQAIAAIAKGGTVFLPAAFCAGHFGVNTSELTSQGGYPLIRFTTGSQVYDDELFIKKMENLIAYRVAQFSDPPAPSGSVNPPAPPVPAVPDKPEEPALQPVNIYLAITGADALTDALSTLKGRQLNATFFLTAEEITANADTVRRAMAEGHYIGLAVTDSADAEAQLQEANEALDAATQSKSLLALLPEGEVPPKVAQAYCLFFRPAVRLTATQAAKAEGQSRLMICNGQTLAESLRILDHANAAFLPLRETSRPD